MTQLLLAVKTVFFNLFIFSRMPRLIILLSIPITWDKNVKIGFWRLLKDTQV